MKNVAAPKGKTSSTLGNFIFHTMKRIFHSLKRIFHSMKRTFRTLKHKLPLGEKRISLKGYNKNNEGKKENIHLAVSSYSPRS